MKNPKVADIKYFATTVPEPGLAVVRPGADGKVEYWFSGQPIPEPFKFPSGTPFSVKIQSLQSDGFTEITLEQFVSDFGATEVYWKDNHTVDMKKFARLLSRALEEPYGFPDEVNAVDIADYNTFIINFLLGEIPPYKTTPDAKKVKVVLEYEDISPKQDKILGLISLGKTEEALERLEILNSNAVMLQSRYNGARRQYIMGMIDFSEWSRTQSVINYAAIEMTNKLSLQKQRQITKVGLKHPRARLAKTPKK